MNALELRPGLADVPVAESAISFIDGKRARLEYRGIAVETLAKESTFEETAWLLLRGSLPNQQELADFDAGLRQHRKLPYQLLDLLKTLPAGGHPMAAMQSGVAALGMYFGAHGKRTPEANWEATAALDRRAADGRRRFSSLASWNEEPIPPREDLDHAGNFYSMLLAIR